MGISRLRSNVFFPDLWKYYHPSHPNIAIELVDGNSSDLDELLQAGNLDLYLGINIPTNPNQHRIELVFESDQQGLVYQFAKNGEGAGLLSPVIFYQYREEIRELGREFFIFPLRSNMQESIFSLVYRKDYPLPRYAMDFVQIACMVIRNYSKFIYAKQD